MADVTEPRTALERARFGRRLGTGDRFVGFWLELAVAGRNASLGGDRRNVARTIRGFVKDTRAAVDEAGVAALHAELRDAAQLYWGSCLTDPQYSSTLFGLKRLDDAELRGKIALEFAQAARLMIDSGALDGPAADLPGLAQWLRAQSDEEIVHADKFITHVVDRQGSPSIGAIAAPKVKVVDTIGAGIMRAREIIESGAARAKLDEFVRFTQQFRSGK